MKIIQLFKVVWWNAYIAVMKLAEPNHETTIKLADYFDVTIDYLLGRVNYSVDANGHLAVKTSQNIFNLDNEELNKKSDKKFNCVCDSI